MNDHDRPFDTSLTPPVEAWHLTLQPVYLTGTGEMAGVVTLWDLRTDLMHDVEVLEPGFDPGPALEDFVEPWLLRADRAVLYCAERDLFTVPLWAAAYAYGHAVALVDRTPSEQHDAFMAVAAYGALDERPSDMADLRGNVRTALTLLREQVEEAIALLDASLEHTFDTEAPVSYGAVHDDSNAEPTTTSGQTTALNPVGRVQGTDDETPGA